MVRAYLLQHGDQVEAMRLLARIGIARKVFDDAELLLAAVLELAPDYRAARTEYAEVLVELHRDQQARGASSSGSCRRIRRTGSTTRACTPPPASASASMSGPLPCTASSCAGRPPTPTCICRSRTHRRRSASATRRSPPTVARPQSPAGLRRCVLEPRQSQDLSLHGRRAGADARPAGRRRRSASWIAFTCVLRSARRWRIEGSFAESFRYYELGNALKRAESRYRPEIIENNTRQQIEVCTPEFFAEPSRLGCAGRGSDLHHRPAALGLDAARTDPGVALAGRGYAGASPISSRSSRRFAAVTPTLNNPRYPRILADLSTAELRQLGERYLEGDAASTAPTSRSSSTRCRTTSGTWASSI